MVKRYWSGVPPVSGAAVPSFVKKIVPAVVPNARVPVWPDGRRDRRRVVTACGSIVPLQSADDVGGARGRVRRG